MYARSGMECAGGIEDGVRRLGVRVASKNGEQESKTKQGDHGTRHDWQEDLKYIQKLY